jgi:hypothetical protein
MPRLSLLDLYLYPETMDLIARGPSNFAMFARAGLPRPIGAALGPSPLKNLERARYALIRIQRWDARQAPALPPCNGKRELHRHRRGNGYSLCAIAIIYISALHQEPVGTCILQYERQSPTPPLCRHYDQHYSQNDACS